MRISQPAASHHAMKRRRPRTSSSLSASRQLPPRAVAPIVAISISESHSRCWLTRTIASRS